MKVFTKRFLRNAQFESIQDAVNKTGMKEEIFIELTEKEYTSFLNEIHILKTKLKDQKEDYEFDILRKKNIYELSKCHLEKTISILENRVENLKEAVSRWKNKASGEKNIRNHSTNINIIREEYSRKGNRSYRLITVNTNYPPDMELNNVYKILESDLGYKLDNGYILKKIHRLYRSNSNCWTVEYEIE